MVDKCPKCGETLVTRTIQKKMGLGSIDLPVAQICPKCNWSRDLTGAGDIVAKPQFPEEAGTGKEIKPEVRRAAAAPLQDKSVPVKPAARQETKKPVPEKSDVVHEKTRQTSAAPVKRVIDTNKVITIILSLLVIAGLIWTFLPKGGSPETTGSTPVPTPDVTSAPTPTSTATATAVTTLPGMPGNNITVKVDRDRGFLIPAQQNLKIRQGDGVIWKNDGSYSLTLVSKDGLFEDRLLDNDKITTYIFKKTGTYTFDIVVRGVKKFEGTVVVEP